MPIVSNLALGAIRHSLFETPIFEKVKMAKNLEMVASQMAETKDRAVSWMTSWLVDFSLLERSDSVGNLDSMVISRLNNGENLI